MNRLHVVSDRCLQNGMFVAAKLMAASEGRSKIVTCGEFLTSNFVISADCEEVVVHGCWLPCYWKACSKVVKANKKLIRMTHANLDPVRYRFHHWKKCLVSPVERWLFKKCNRVIVTCRQEREWCEQWGIRGPFEVVDLKRFFNLDGKESLAYRSTLNIHNSLHVLYLGREHPLKGVRFLEQAVREVNESGGGGERIELRVVSDHTGEELERDWKWCDVLCLPTLSDNFGLVVAEALERGKRVITTDGAPAWESGSGAEWERRLVYLRGFRDGSDAEKVRLLKEALDAWAKSCG